MRACTTEPCACAACHDAWHVWLQFGAFVSNIEPGSAAFRDAGRRVSTALDGRLLLDHAAKNCTRLGLTRLGLEAAADRARLCNALWALAGARERAHLGTFLAGKTSRVADPCSKRGCWAISG